MLRIFDQQFLVQYKTASDVSDVLLQSIFKLNDDEKLSYKYYNKRITARDNGKVQTRPKRR